MPVRERQSLSSSNSSTRRSFRNCNFSPKVVGNDESKEKSKVKNEQVKENVTIKVEGNKDIIFKLRRYFNDGWDIKQNDGKVYHYFADNFCCYLCSEPLNDETDDRIWNYNKPEKVKVKQNGEYFDCPFLCANCAQDDENGIFLMKND